VGRLRKLIPRFSLRTLVVFMLLCTSGLGLWWHWGPWYLKRVLAQPPDVVHIARFREGGRRAEVIFDGEGDYSTASTYDVRTGQLLERGRARDSIGKIHDLRDAAEGMADVLAVHGLRRAELFIDFETGERWGIRIFDTRTETVIAEMRIEQTTLFGAVISQFSPDGDRLLTYDMCAGAYLFARRRPEWWWGVFYLWEFRSTVAFAGMLVWSVIRDRSGLARPASALGDR